MVAESADVAGRIVGNVAVSGILVLKATARLDGDDCARRLAIEPKATLNGKCVMIDEPESLFSGSFFVFGFMIKK